MTQPQQPSRIDIDDDDIMIDESEVLLYQGVPYTGEAVETVFGDSIIAINVYRNGRENGVQREFYTDGSLRSEYNAVNGQAVGTSREWHENGQLARRKEFNEYGSPFRVETWDENGVSTGENPRN